jgi:hypothetical protein
MDTNNFLTEFTNNIDHIRTNEFEKFNFKYEEKVIEQKVLNENIQEFTEYKYKNSKGIKKSTESENSTTNIDILEDDIFINGQNENPDDEIKLDVDLLDRDKKLSMVHDFLQRKNINLDEENLKKIEDIIDNPDLKLKKFLNISKIYQQISRITFIKKLENGSYIVDISENKTKKSKKYFN